MISKLWTQAHTPRFWIRLLLNTGLLIQFHLMIVMVVSFLATAIHDSYSGYTGGDEINDLLFDHFIPLCIATLIFLCAEYTFFLILARKRSLLFALRTLIVLNIIHSSIWLFFYENPFTMIRLLIPTFLYIFTERLLFYSPEDHAMKVESFFTMIFRFFGRIYLNIRVCLFALSGKWLDSSEIRKDYDDLAADYDRTWLVHLKETTGSLISLLPDSLDPGSTILDLGCGTGWSSGELTARYPNARIIGIDLSPGMLKEAESRVKEIPAIQLIEGDLLDDLQQREPNSADLIFSAWAIGYSDPNRFICEAGRVLRPGGSLAAVVNKMDTLPAVFDAYRKTMYRFPHHFQKAFLPKFPYDSSQVKSRLARSGFEIVHFQDFQLSIPIPPQGDRVNMLLKTGILAGFDELLPLRTNAKVRDFFSRELGSEETGWEHHGLLFLARKGSR
ncbi:MAG: class I SAM-dependent methyltransferase [Planctomycetia bacterium]|nr:class I SAM-dependent methyltransferase [Planctomycetia bacterium]